MGDGDTTDAGSDSIDLYSGVKLRALHRKVHCVADDAFAADDGKSANARSRKSSSRIRKGVFSENVAAHSEKSSRKNDTAVGNSSLGELVGVTVEETNASCTWRSENKQMNQRFPVAQDFDKSDLQLDERIAIKMPRGLSRERPKSSSGSRFDIGDLVWGRVKPFPWWPGQVFDEALAAPSVLSHKRAGGILISFYGDYTFAWLGPGEIITFDVNYAENLKQTKAKKFLIAVEEATAEIKRRVALGLVCHCQKDSNLQLKMIEGNSVKQLQKAREHFHPQEIIYFLKQFASNPRKDVNQNPHWIKNVANIFAHRKAVVKELDESLAQDVEPQNKSPECFTETIKENQKARQASFSSTLHAEAQAEIKSFARLTEVPVLQTKYLPNIPREWLSRKYFEYHELLSKGEESKHDFRQDEPYNLHVFSANRRAVESEIYSSGLVRRSGIAENLEKIPEVLSKHNSSPVLSLKVETICHQVENSPLKIFPDKTYPRNASRNFCSSKPLEEEFRPYVDAGNKRRTLGHPEDFCMQRSVGLNEMKSFAVSDANNKLLNLQGQSQPGIRSNSSIQPQKNSQIKQNSIRRDVKERTLTVKFPSQSMLPSVSEIKSKFACFGPLDEYCTRVFRASSACQLVFLKKADAEAAYLHAIHNSTLFNTSEVKYYLQASVPDLNDSSISSVVVENREEIHPVTSLSTKKLASDQTSMLCQPSLVLPEKIQLKSSPKYSEEGLACPSITRSHTSETITLNSESPLNTVPSPLLRNFRVPPSHVQEMSNMGLISFLKP